MTNAELIAKIKAEIERRIALYSLLSENTVNPNRIDEDRQLLSFLSTLESETAYDTQQYTPRPSVGIEDVARVQFASHAKVFDKKRKAVFDWEQFKEVAGIFYGFGKKDTSDSLESEKPINQDDIDTEIGHWMDHLDDKYCMLVNHYSIQDIKDTAHHFYELGKNSATTSQDDGSETPNDLEEAADEYEKANTGIYPEVGQTSIRDAFIDGAKWDREQMMKGAVDAIVENWNPDPEPEITIPLNPEEFTRGDKVRVIICKKEDEK